MNKKDIISLILISLVSIGFISYFTVSHIYSLRKLNESANDLPEERPLIFLDLNNKKTMEEILSKIRHYETIVPPIKHFSALEAEEEKKSKKIRKLDESNIFENVGLIDSSVESVYNTGIIVAKSIKQFSTNLIVYPYKFNYVSQENSTLSKEFKYGAYINLDPSILNEYNKSLINKGIFSTKRSRAVYDADFAILSIEFARDYNKDDAFQDSIDWDDFLHFYLLKGKTLDNYDQFLQAKKNNASKTYSVKINETEIIKGNLLNEGLPRFGILIIPDYILGTDEIIKSKLGETGIKKIKEFYEKGGKIIVNGKSGTLLEDFGLMTKGVYNRKKLLSVNLESMHIRGLGCSEKEYKENEDDFEKQMICMYGPEKYFVIASSFLSVKNDSNYIPVMHLDSSNKYLVTTDVDDGLTYNLTEKERIYNPLILYKKNKQNGYIFVLNHNPFIYGGDKRSVLNIILLSLSRELLMTSKVNLNTNISNPDLIDNLPIPAGEFGFQLQIKIFIHNLNDKSMENSKLYLFLADNFAWVPNTLNCVEKKYIASEILSDIKQKKTINNNNTYYICDLKTILPYQKTDFKINIKVLNYEATQMKYNVLIMEPFFTYLDSNKKENVLFNPIKANCEAAPVLSGAMNPDPSSFYPYLGIGAYIDNVLKIENKEESMAYNVEYYGLIPVLSPILDIDDQRKTQKSLKIYVDYYNSHNFEVPLTSDEAEDFIYPAELNGKGVYIVMNWDSPILPVKEISNSQGSGQPINIIGINHGPVTLNSTSEIIKQINYRKSERLYKLASQRLMAFVDTTTPEGAKAIYNGNIPSDLLDPVHKDRTKTEFLFSRLDIYFYDNENYVNPPGISEKQVITVDKYKTYSSKSDCVEKRGMAKSEIAEKGFFTNFDKNKKDIILQPNIYTNALFEYCDLTIIDPTVKGSLEKFLKIQKI